jgi:hypothetical protein
VLGAFVSEHLAAAQKFPRPGAELFDIGVRNDRVRLALKNYRWWQVATKVVKWGTFFLPPGCSSGEDF